jgi:ribulose bisphosphate carboxylase small subunit
MPRKCVVKVVLSKEQREILNELARRLGTSESETLRMALMDYAKELSLMKESIHRGKTKFKAKLSSNSDLAPKSPN